MFTNSKYIDGKVVMFRNSVYFSEKLKNLRRHRLFGLLDLLPQGLHLSIQHLVLVAQDIVLLRIFVERRCVCTVKKCEKSM